MKQIDIENKAVEYSEDLAPAYVNGDFDKYSIQQAFIDGAEWRIDHVWHDMDKEVPQIYGEYGDMVAPSIPCLVLGHLSTGYGYGVRYWNVEYCVWDDEEGDDFECKRDRIEQWAYLDDLLPKEEIEVTEQQYRTTREGDVI